MHDFARHDALFGPDHAGPADPADPLHALFATAWECLHCWEEGGLAELVGDADCPVCGAEVMML